MRSATQISRRGPVTTVTSDRSTGSDCFLHVGHLHEVEVDETRYGVPDPDEDGSATNNQSEVGPY